MVQPSLPTLDLPIAPRRDRSPAHCTTAKLWAAHCMPWQLRQPCPLPQSASTSFTQTRPILQLPGGLRRASIPAKVAICCRRVLGCHPHPSCAGQGAGLQCDLIQSMWLQMRFVPKQVVQCASPACDSLDHRAGVCYLPCSLRRMNFVMPLACASLSVPPSAF